MERFRLVAVVSGRRSEEVARLLDVAGVHAEGLYGLRGSAPELAPAAMREAEAAAGRVPGAWVEDKGVSIAVHYRQAPDPTFARSRLRAALEPVASRAGLELVEGKMVFEFVPADRSMKGGAVERLVAEHGLSAALFAGDDVADLDAFVALDRMSARGLIAVKVAVGGEETPSALLTAADLVVDGPEGLVGLLRQLI